MAEFEAHRVIQFYFGVQRDTAVRRSLQGCALGGIGPTRMELWYKMLPLSASMESAIPIFWENYGDTRPC